MVVRLASYVLFLLFCIVILTKIGILIPQQLHAITPEIVSMIFFLAVGIGVPYRIICKLIGSDLNETR